MHDGGTLGERLASVRKRRGLTQRELATVSGMSVSLIRKIEQDDYGQVRLATARKLAQALGVRTSALVTEPDAPVAEPESAQRWEPVRLALEGVHGEVPQEEPTLESLGRSFGDVLPPDRQSEPAPIRTASGMEGRSPDELAMPSRVASLGSGAAGLGAGGRPPVVMNMLEHIRPSRGPSLVHPGVNSPVPLMGAGSSGRSSRW